jgi:hypothetical protein
MAIKIKHTDPTLNSFATDDLIINVQSGSLFFKSNTTLYKLQGDNQATTDIIEFSGLSSIIQDTSGNIGIGTNDPKEKLHIYEGTALVKNISYVANQNAPYLIAGTQNYTGATTNWGTYGMQHRFKVNAGGSPRLTIDSYSAELFTIENAGNIGIGKSAPTTKLDVNGTVTCTGFDGSSDINLKTNINNIETPLETISKLKGITFEWKNHIIETDKTLQGIKHGLIAQEVEKILPSLVHTSTNKTVSYIEIIPILVEAIKEQQNQIEEQQKQIDKLKNKLNG